jgi:hypothetical protein
MGLWVTCGCVIRCSVAYHHACDEGDDHGNHDCDDDELLLHH